MPIALSLFAGKPDDLAPRTAELTLQRLHPLDRRVEVLLEKSFENFHEYDSQRFSFDFIKITPRRSVKWSSAP